MDTPQEHQEVTMYGAPWCGYCNKTSKMLEDHESELKEAGINVHKVDCTTDEGKGVCAAAGVTGYPTFQTACGDKQAGAFRDIESFKDFAGKCGSE